MYLWIVLFGFILAMVLLIRFLRKGGLILQKKRHLTPKSILIPEHYWEEADQTGFYYCCVCNEVGGNLFNKRLVECLICGALRHASCPMDEKIPCKSMTYGSATRFNSHQVIYLSFGFEIWILTKLVGQRQSPIKLHLRYLWNGLWKYLWIRSFKMHVVPSSGAWELHAVKNAWRDRSLKFLILFRKSPETCDFGALADAIIRPSQVKVTQKPSSTIAATKAELKDEIKTKLKLKDDKPEESIPKYTISGGTKIPIVAIVNKRSGGQMGHKVLSSFYNHLNPIQVRICMKTIIIIPNYLRSSILLTKDLIDWMISSAWKTWNWSLEVTILTSIGQRL